MTRFDLAQGSHQATTTQYIHEVRLSENSGRKLQQHTHLGPHDRNFLARINSENYLRGATERNTR